MKRLILEILLGLLAAAGAGGTWWMWSQASVAQTALASANNELQAGAANIEALNARLRSAQPKAAELDAVRAALASGVALEDLEAAAKARPPSAERLLALGAVRLLVKGASDAEVRQHFEKALELVEWNTRLRAVCAAQAGLIAAGNKVEMLGDCRTLAAAEAAAAAAKAAAQEAAAAAAAPLPGTKPGAAPPPARPGAPAQPAAGTNPGAAPAPAKAAPK